MTSDPSLSGVRWVMRCGYLAIAVLSARAPVAMAQSLQDESQVGAGVGELQMGRSVAYYGIQGDVEQRASARAVLLSAQLDRTRYVPSAVEAGTAFLLKLVLGGGGAPSDLAAGRKDVEDVFRE